jgi:flagellar protein FlbD
MIIVTRFDGTEIAVNADLIEFVEASPDTHLTLVTGKKMLVREPRAEVIARVLAWRQAAGPLLSRPRAGDLAGEHQDAY